MPIVDGKYVTPAWQNGGPPALDAAELTDIGNSIVTNQTNILTNTQNIQTNQQNIETLQSTVQNINENYLNKTGDTMSGQLGMGGNIITNLGVPSSSTDAVNKSYVDNLSSFSWELIYSQALNINATSSTQTVDIDTPNAITDARTKYIQIIVVIRGSYTLDTTGTVSPNFRFNDNVLFASTPRGSTRGNLYAVCSYGNVCKAYSLREYSQFWGYKYDSVSPTTLPFAVSSGMAYDRLYVMRGSSYSQTFNGTIYYYGLSAS